MPTGIFTLKQQELALGQGAWPNASFQSTFGARFNGTGSGQYLTGPTTSALNLGTGNFTIEFWIYINAYGAQNLTVAFSASNGGSDFQLSFNAGSQYVYWHNSGVQIAANSAASFTPGRWTHIALVRSGTTVGLFCDGTRYGTVTNSASINLTNFNIGSYWTSVTSYVVDGWVSNLRITNTAVYDPTASSLTLPLGPLTAISGTQLLTLQNATIVDNSANALTITNNGSVPMQVVYPFGGLAPYKTLAVDYLVVAGGGAGGGGYGAGGGGGGLLQGNLPVATGSALTVTVGGGGTGGSNAAGTNGSNSVFSSITAIGGGFGPAGQAAGGSGGSGGGSGGNPSGRWGQGVAGQGNRGGDAGSGTGPAPGGGGGAGARGSDGNGEGPAGTGGAGAASDISGTRTVYAGGGGGSTYLRGASGYNGLGGPGGGGAGGDSNGNNNGIAGTANTGGGGGGGSTGGGASSGGNGGSGIVIISYPDTYAPAVATTGAPVASTSGSGSIGFNGSTQVLVYNSNAAFQFGTGNFTWETWVYVAAGGGNFGIYDLGAINSAGSFGVFTGGTVIYVRIDGSSNDLTYTAPASFIGNWVHLAVVRQGTTMTLYYNGTSVASGTRSNNVTQQTPYVGNLNGLNYYLNGYLSNTRVVKGSAVYTSNFTPSTAPLTAVTNTSLLLNSVSGAYLADSSTNGFAPTSGTVTPTWNQLSPFATGLGYKNRVYTWTSSGSITF